LQAFTEGLIEGHIATDIIITISIWAGLAAPAGQPSLQNSPAPVPDKGVQLR